MKIFIVIHGFLPYNVAGSEVYTYNLAKELAKENEVHIFHRIANPNLEEYKLLRNTFDGLSINAINHTFKYRYAFEGTYTNEEIDARFADLLDEIRPDIVHFSHLIYLSTNLVREAKKRDILAVFTLNDFWLACPLGQLLMRSLILCSGPDTWECAKCMAPKLAVGRSIRDTSEVMKRKLPAFKDGSILKRILGKVYGRYTDAYLFFHQKWARAVIQKRMNHIQTLYSQTDLFIAPSRFLLEKFVELGIPRQKLLYADYGFDTSLFDNFSKTSSDKIRFGYIGTFSFSKGVDYLLKAFRQLANTNAQLRIHGSFVENEVGHEGYPSHLQSLLNKTKNALLFGEYDNKDIAKILSEIDVLVVPSIWWENSPLVIHEAFMAGIPVIAGDIGGMAELVQDGVNGLHFKVADSSDLAAKMRLIVETPALIGKLSKTKTSVIPIAQHALEIGQVYQDLVRRQ